MMSGDKMTVAMVSILVILAMLLPACAPRTPTPQPTPTSGQTPAPGGLQPVSFGPLPPVLVSRTPAPGEEWRPGQPVVLTFDQPMDAESVKAAFSMRPALEGELRVEGRSVIFTPKTAPERSATYHLTLAETAKSAAGLALSRPLELRLQTVGFLEVSSVQPADGAIDVSPDSMILVVFNRPVVPLTSIEDQKGLPQPLVIEPALEGEGAWVNTSVYAFKPAKGLAPSTEYWVTVKAGLQDTTGGELTQDFTWSFYTARAEVISTEPAGDMIAPESPITVTFSVAMDPASTEQAFSLRHEKSGEQVAGTFQWSEDGRQMIFRPAEMLRFGEEYQALIDDTARPAVGEETLLAPAKWSFRVVPLPAVKSTSPAQEAKNVDPYSGVEIYFTAPVVEKTIAPNLRIIPEPTDVYTYYSEYEARLWISFSKEPQTDYTIILGAGISDRWGNHLPGDFTLRFRTGDYPPSLSLVGASGMAGTYNAYWPAEVVLNHRNIEGVEWALFRLSLENYLKFEGDSGWREYENFVPSERDLLFQGQLAFDTKPNALGRTKLSVIGQAGATLPPGLYFLRVLPTGMTQKERAQYAIRHVMIVSPYHLILKTGAVESLLWATDWKTGDPVRDIPVHLYDKGAKEIAAGRTDERGLFQSPHPQQDMWSSVVAVLGDPAEPVGVISRRWNDGISPWEFDIPSENYIIPYWVGHLYTDRPIYRPGQTVHFKGVLRADDDAQYSLPTSISSVRVRINDPQGNKVYEETLPLSPMGTFAGDFELAEEAALGYYYMEAIVLGESEDQPAYSFGQSFQVAEYRKPEYQVSVTTDKDEYIQGDVINAAVQANYYFGGPVRNAKVEWTIFSQDYWFEYQGKGWYSFQDYDWTQEPGYSFYGREIASGAGQTDAEGRFVFQVPALIQEARLSQQFTIDVTITDVNDQVVAGRASAIVHKGEYYIGLRAQRYVLSAGQPADIEIITVDPQSQPMPNIPLRVVAYSTRWDNVQQEDEYGNLYWTSKVIETPVITRTVTTDANGQATFTFVPEKGGSYRVRAIGRDHRENEIRSAVDIWVSGRPDEFVSWRQENNYRIELVADQKEYRPGDVATILIPSPFSGPVKALVTVERGRLYSVKLMELTSNSATISVPIREQYVPNIFVSVVLVKPQDAADPLGSFRVGYIQLPVTAESKELKVEVIPDKDTYQPRDAATFTIRATDWMGRPVQAEFSLGLIDKAVLALGGPGQGLMKDAFWHERGLGFTTAGSLVTSVNVRAEQAVAEMPAGKGGGGGMEGADMFVRTEFPDTAYWNPWVTTDASGQASVTVTLPDNLTTWRMDARGITADTRVGVQTADVIATLPLMARPVLPRFFVIGDEVEISCIVHNNTDAPASVQVTLSADGVETADVLGRTVDVPAHGLQKLSWRVRVQAVEQARIRFTAEGAGLRDAVEHVLPVYHPSTPEVVATAGQIDAKGERVEAIVLPQVLDPSMGELTVTIDPSLAAGMRDGLKYLESYPYECIEQTVSRFLPNVFTYRALKSLGIRNPELEEKLPTLVSTALQKLYSAQRFNGGWGWWVRDDTDNYLTAYVLFGMTEAARAGFPVDQDVMARAARYLRERQYPIRTTTNVWQINRDVFQLYVLANYDEWAGEDATRELSRAVLLFDNRQKMGIWAKALLANALGAIDPGQKSRVDTLLSDIYSQAILSATGAHWEEAYQDYRNMNTDTRTTAIVLSALARYDKDNPLAGNAVRWLMSVRKEGRWESTYETVWALLGLTDWMVATGELEGDYSFAVDVNGNVIAQGKVTPENVDEQVKAQVAIADLLLDQANRLLITRSAGASESDKGRLYYTAHLKYYLPAEEVKELSRGVIVSREYRLADAPDTPITAAKVGDVIQVRLTIIAPNDLHYVVVEDPLPAGCEAIDTSLETTSATMEPPRLEQVDKQKGPWWKWWWYGWWTPTHTELRDEKVVLFATYLAKGTYQYTYLMRASLPGSFQVMPATAYEMYFPEVFGRSAGRRFEITR